MGSARLYIFFFNLKVLCFQYIISIVIFFFFLCNNLFGIMATLTRLEKIGSSKMNPLS